MTVKDDITLIRNQWGVGSYNQREAWQRIQAKALQCEMMEERLKELDKIVFYTDFSENYLHHEPFHPALTSVAALCDFILNGVLSK